MVGNNTVAMPITLQAAKPVALAANVFTVPTPLSQQSLQSLLPLLSSYGVDSFQPTADKGAILGSINELPQIVISPISRSVTVAVPTWEKASDEVERIVSVVAGQLPVSQYAAAQITMTVHIPVAGQSADNLLRGRLLSDAAFVELGSEATGTGFKIFLNRQLGYLAIEPLLTDDSMLFVQLVRIHPVAFAQPILRTLLGDLLRYYQGNVVKFLIALFQGANG